MRCSGVNHLNSAIHIQAETGKNLQLSVTRNDNVWYHPENGRSLFDGWLESQLPGRHNTTLMKLSDNLSPFQHDTRTEMSNAKQFYVFFPLPL